MKKKVSLSTQLFINIVPMFAILMLYIINKYKIMGIGNSSLTITIYNFTLLLVAISGFMPSELSDEFARVIFAKADRICIRTVKIVILLLIVFLGAPMFKDIPLDRIDIGALLCVFLVGLTALRAILFYIYNKRGIQVGCFKNQD